MTLRELRAKRTETEGRLRAITTGAETRGGDLTDDEKVEADRLMAEARDLDRRIGIEERFAEAERRSAGAPVTGSGDTRFDDACRDFSLVRAIAAAAGMNVDAGREREISAELARRQGHPARGVLVPMAAIEQRTLTTTAPMGGPGGNLVGTDHRGDLYFDRLRARLIIGRLGARVLSGLRGNVEIPRLTESTTAGWVAENAPLTPSTPAFGQIGMTPRHCGALTEISRNMLLQSSPDIEQLVRDDLAKVLAEAVDRVAIKGGGAQEPVGILGTDGIGAVEFETPSWDGVLEFIERIEIENADASAWATNPRVVRALRRTLKVEGDAAAGFLMGEPGSLAGYPLASSTLVPSDLGDGGSPEAFDRSALIFGNFNDLLVGYWSALDILVNPFESTAYAKGNIQIRAMLSLDLAVRHVESFVAATDVATSAGSSGS